MRILIIDDDYCVVKSLLAGLKFDKIGFDDALGVTSAAEAKEKFSEYVIDVVLCDIEMPGENGIQLIAWVRENYPETICIFLTSHAEFSYAQKGLKLGCFDYIIQPALYSEIEEVLRRAIVKVHMEAQKKSLFTYGGYLKGNETEVVGAVMNNILYGQKKNIKEELKKLATMGFKVNEFTRYQMVQIQELTCETINGKWEESLKCFTLKNIFCEILEIPYENVLFGWASDKEFIFVIIDMEFPGTVFEERMRKFHQTIIKLFHTQCAIYIGENVFVDEIYLWRDRIDKEQKNNVMQEAKIFWLHEDSGKTESGWNKRAEVSDSILKLNSIDYNVTRWRTLLIKGNLRIVSREIHMYFEKVTQNNIVSLNALIEFHEYFTQMILNVMYERKINVTEFFQWLQYPYSEFMDSYHTVQQLTNAVDKIISGMMEYQESEQKQETEIALAQKYILDNIMENISVQEVAESVHFTPEYLTKLFKKETGLNLKEYIISEKFNVAKDMLKSTYLPIGTIAASLGYTNLSHFIAMFRKREGLTPSDYRKRETDTD